MEKEIIGKALNVAENMVDAAEKLMLAQLNENERLKASNAELLAALEAITKLGTFTGPVSSSYINSIIEAARVAVVKAKDRKE